MIVQTNAEREAAGKLTNTPWMGAAIAEGLPTAHMGGIGGFTSLADGIDRALAGVEPGFEPQRVYDALAGDTHSIHGVRALEARARGTSTPTSTSRPGSAAQTNGSTAQTNGRCPRPPVPKGRCNGTLPSAGSSALTSAAAPYRSSSGQQLARRASPVSKQTSTPGREAGHGTRRNSSSREPTMRARGVGAAEAPEDPLSALSAKQLAALAQERGIDITGCLERNDLLELLRDSPF